MVYLDFETRSNCDIKKAGAWAYAEHETTSVLCLAYAIGDGPVQLWTPEDPAPIELFYVLTEGNLVEAHNAFFERAIWENICVKKLGWPAVKPDQWRCSAAKVSARALPRALANVAVALDVAFKKDMSGRSTMLKLSRYKEGMEVDDIMDLYKLYEYCKSDVEAERAVSKAVRDLSPLELRIWQMDQTINARGVLVDIETCKGAMQAIAKIEERLLKEFIMLTGNKNFKPSQRNVLLEWLKDEGTSISGLTKAEVIKLLGGDELSPIARRVLEIRQELSRTSTAKFQAMLLSAGRDGRIRDTLMYHGAATGRWTGKIVQMHNIPRGSTPVNEDTFQNLRRGESTSMAQISSCIRGMLIPKEGHEFIVADYNAIEARVLLWLADEEAGLQAYRRKEDIYKLMASRIYRCEIKDVTKEQRTVGKTTILGCLAENTCVLSDSGIKYIQDVKLEDKLWDGKNWVAHGGLLRAGSKPVITIKQLDNIELTPDHLLLTPEGWQTAEEIVLLGDTQHLQRTLNLAQSPLSGESINRVQSVVSVFAANAELKKALELTNSGSVKNNLVLDVLNLETDRKEEILKEIPILYLIHALEHDGLPRSIMQSGVVKIIETPALKIMVLDKLKCTSSPVDNFWNILFHSLAGITGASLSTELIIPKDTLRVILDWLPKRSTIETKEKECYDIKDCGPYQRFKAGGVIAHNCGYGMGAKKFKDTIKLNVGVDVTEEFAQNIINTYREQFPNVKKMWYAQENAAVTAIKNPGRKISCGKVTWGYDRDDVLYCRLPSGRLLAYNSPRVRASEKWEGKTEITCMVSSQGQWVRESTYGGKLVENITQAIARDILANGMLNCEAKGYPVVLSIHDEIVVETPVGKKSIEGLINNMTDLPMWAKDCPIEAEGWKGFRYKK